VEEEPLEIQGVTQVKQHLYHVPTPSPQVVEYAGKNSVHLFMANEPGIEASSRPPEQLASGQAWMTADYDQLYAVMTRHGINQSDLGFISME